MATDTGTIETTSPPLDNERIADALDEVAELLEAQGANPFRVRAYRRAAGTVRELDRPVRGLVEEGGAERVRELPGIGASLARALEELTRTGRLALLERLRGGGGSEHVLTTVPGIGPELAARIHEELGIETLVDLETAAYDGRLAGVPGMGSRRVLAVRESLAGRFRRRPGTPVGRRDAAVDEEVPVSELLEIDREYRAKAAADRLPRIAPRRFNPTGEAWLPILHAQRGGRHFTALYSNTARAHELGTTHDWVVIYRDDHDGHGQWTVVTARFGPLRGLRVVRGREEECRDHHERGGETLFEPGDDDRYRKPARSGRAAG